MTSASMVGSHFNEFPIRQAFSAFSRTLRAFSASAPNGTERRTCNRISVKRVTPSKRSTAPVASQTTFVQEIFATLATARNVKTRQSATAATTNVSGDHRFPGPSNSRGGAEMSGFNPGDVISLGPCPPAVQSRCNGEVAVALVLLLPLLLVHLTCQERH
jgi:hypothetical protein